MNLIRSVIHEVFGLFFDDGFLCVGLLVWVGFCAVAFASLAVPQIFEAPVWGLGCVAILIGSVMRRAGRG